VQDTLEENLGATECESGNEEVSWNNFKKRVIDTMSNFIGKVKRNARKQWISQEMINKMGQRRETEECKQRRMKEGRTTEYSGTN
jgi:hypothetical protein